MGLASRLAGLKVAMAAAAATLIVLFAAPDAGAAVLHNQYDNVDVNSILSSAQPNDSIAADDFVVPAGQSWSLESIDVRANTTNQHDVDVNVYADAATLPGSLLAGRSSATTGATMDKSVAISPPVVLLAGTYWISVQSTTTGWGWFNRTAQFGNGAAFMSNVGPAECTNMWGRLDVCYTGPDVVFRLNGTSTLLPAPAPAPVAKKCKKGFRLKTIKKKGKKRKKCMRRKKKR